MNARFEVYQDKAGLYRWRLLARNGRIIADSGEGYLRKADAHRAITTTVQAVAGVVAAQVEAGG